MISFIVSTYNRPNQLLGCVASLAIQDRDKEIIICDNSLLAHVPDNKKIASMFRCTYIRTALMPNGISETCYHKPSYTYPKGKWLGFPSDDSYYVPGFSRIMIDIAEQNGWEFVYCDTLYDPRLAHATRGEHNTYSVLDVRPGPGGIDKTSFLITRRAFDQVGGWPSHESDWRDGILAQNVVDAGIPHGKAPGVMVVHN